MVDKRLILSVAGSGKTCHLIEKLNTRERFFIITYTITNTNLISSRVIKRFGYLPNNIKIFTFFNFLYNFCVKPFVFYKYGIRGINLDNSPDFTSYLKNTDINKYLSKKGYLYHNRISKFIEFEKLHNDIRSRLEQFCDFIFFDEVQDLGGHDFNLIMELTKANINFLFVGDFYQHTYVTSFDGNINATLYSDFVKFQKRYIDNKIYVDKKSLNKSWRCSITICRYITDNLNIIIGSHRTDETEITIIEDKISLTKILNDDNIIKLVYNNARKRNFRAKNWGECKGEDDYTTTCIILNKTTYRLFKKSALKDLAHRTKNKLYVALSRTRGDCYLVEEDLIG